MKLSTVYAIVWVSCSAAVIAGIIVTGRLVPLWALLIPMGMSVSSGSKGE